MQELNDIVAQKTGAIRDVGIELDVHQQAAREMINRIQQQQQRFETQAKALEKIDSRISEYDKAVGQLIEMTTRAQENMARLKKESLYVDRVAKRLENTSKQLDIVERRIPNLTQEFQTRNEERLKEISSGFGDALGKQYAHISERIEESRGVVDTLKMQLEEHVAGQMVRIGQECEAMGTDVRHKITSVVQDADTQVTNVRSTLGDYQRQIIDMNDQHRERIQTIEGEEADFVNGLEHRLNDYREQVEAMQDENDERLRQKIEEYHRQEQAYRDETQENLHRQMDEHREQTQATREECAGYLAQVRDQFITLQENTSSQLQSSAERTIQETIENCRANIEQERDDLQHTIERMATGIDERVDNLNMLSQQLDDHVAEHLNRVQREADTMGASVYNKIAEAAHEGEVHINTLRANIKEVVQSNDEYTTSIRQEYDTMNETLRTMFTDVAERFNEYRQQLEELNERRQTRMQTIENEEHDFTDHLRQYLDDYRQKAATIQEDYVVKLDRVSEQGKTIEQQGLEQFQDDVARHMAEMTTQYQARIEEVRAELDRTIEQTAGATDERLNEFNTQISYRFEKAETLHFDIDQLESALKGSMEQVSTRVLTNFRQHEEDMEQEQGRLRDVHHGMMNGIRSELDVLEKRVGTYKQDVHEKMSEHLTQVEENLKSEIGRRSLTLDEQLANWQTSMREQFDKAEQLAYDERTGFMQRQTELMNEHVEEFRLQQTNRFSTIETEIMELHNGLDRRIETIDQSINRLQSEVREEVASANRTIYDAIHEEFQKRQSAMQVQIDDFVKETETRIENQREKTITEHTQLQSNVETTKSDMAVWQAHMTQQMQTARQEAQEIYEELSEHARGGLEEFHANYDTFRAQIEEHGRDMSQESDVRMREFREFVQTTREHLTAQQQKMLGRVESEAKLLSVKLDEIDKRQRGFIQQTKLFERADTLKDRLRGDIDDLRADLQTVEQRRNELRELDGTMQKIRKVATETNERLKQLLSERKRIDTLKDRYGQLVALSETVELRLEQIDSRNDVLQAIQAKMRTMESMEKEIEERYARLERKEKIVIVTTEGVDKNFHDLEQIETRMQDVYRELGTIPEQIEQLNKRLEYLAETGKEANEASQLIERLDTILADVEKRTDRLHETREWIGRTETRLEKATREVDERVKLLNTLLKSDMGNIDAQTLPNDTKDLVVKLAHQGWTVEEIARQTQISRGEVEVILGLAGN